MYSFANDYSEGACPKVMDALNRTNNIQTPGYGLDVFCETATNIIKKLTNHNDIDVHYITGGTPCNVLAASLLKPYEALIAVETGHINVHETGGIELTGHKILTCKGYHGKITPSEIEQIVLKHIDEHMVKPKMVFISNATEYGTVYYKKELEDIANICKQYDLYLYMDGARIGNALTANDNDLTLEDITNYCDLFYIGGTKNGMLLGEAMVIKNDELKPNFRYLIKQHSSMLAKTRIIGLQFLVSLEDDTYFENARNANYCAQSLKYVLKQAHIKSYIDSSTNQIFSIIDNKLLERIKTKYIVTEWDKYDDNHTIVRFVCSWATKKSDIQSFFNDLIDFLNY